MPAEIYMWQAFVSSVNYLVFIQKHGRSESDSIVQDEHD